MLSFLRKTRLAIIDAVSIRIPVSPLGKYSIYAIGEIALVVIGILIALQINNWNQERKNKVLEREYVLRLKDEMKENLVFFESRIEFDSFGISNVDLILSALKNDKIPSDSEQLAVAVEQIGWGLHFQHVDDVWNELINNGNIRLLHNEELRDKITSYHSQVDAIIDVQYTWVEFALGYRRLVGNILEPDLRTYIAAKYGPAILSQSVPSIPSTAYILEELAKIDGLYSYLADIKIGQSVNVAMMETGMDFIKEIITICDQELN